MKIKILAWLSVLTFAAVSLAPAAEDVLNETLRRGLFEEEANHDLNAAIKAYQSLIRQNDEQRKVVATAVFRLGECYRKLGKTSDAIAQYERVRREYSDQANLVRLSEQNLTGLGVNPASVAEAEAISEDEEKELKRIKALLKNSPDLINGRHFGLTLLDVAAAQGQVAVAKFLLANKAEVNALTPATSETPLQIAAKNAHKTMVELLLANGADVNARGVGGTALHAAASSGYRTVAEVLLANKADVNARNPNEENLTPLHLAARNGHKALVELLLKNGAHVNARDKQGRTPLDVSDQPGITALLQELGAERNASQSRQGESFKNPRVPKPLPPDGPLAGRWEQRSRTMLRGRIFHSAIWTGEEMIVWGGGAEHHFHDDGGIYNPYNDKWRPVSQKNAPSGRWGHAAVWTGTEMIIWGGRNSFSPTQNKNDGARYNPATESWTPMNLEGAPEPRSQMAAVWTGKELIVWGGWGDGGICPSGGGRYNPKTDTWTPLPTENAPEARMEPGFVWTGEEMIVWGGLLQGEKNTSDTGARYNPEKNTWTPLPAKGALASVRGHQAVWTGTEMIVWGGGHLEGDGPAINVGMNTGARYNPKTDSWQPTEINGAPDGRMYYTATWTGSEMIIWGGGDQVVGNFITGGRYNPVTDSWIATANTGAPSGRGIATAVWTGEGVLIFGGSTGGVEAFNDTYYYLPKAKPAGPKPVLEKESQDRQ